MGQVAFFGNVGKVKEIQLGQDGKARLSFSVAESHSRFDKQANKWQDTGTTWRNVTVFGKRAEALAQILQNGAKQQVVVIGREETRDYESNGETRQSFDCTADHVGLVPKLQQQNPGTPPAAQAFGNQPNQSQGGGWNAPQQSQPPANDPWSAGGGNAGGGWGNPQQSEAPF